MNKKLYRGNGYIGGVCEGLGEWSGVSPTIWRILAVSALILFSFTPVIYALMWAFVEPKND